ncbi:hypothetical protein A0H81_14198 [Grifola frondosa]|uniref:YCII-related domain-containing protein n=1 Tax=Grifola frondosa TaxID=5627 RepID=A0A1C7LM89_GRIFR|nr:hypothetical protein A0H81_14198 [Grifola frondosa]
MVERAPRIGHLRLSSLSPTMPHLFVVYLPDYTDAEAFQRRLSVRQAHLEKAHQNSKIKVGGAMLTPESIESPTAEKKMIGSMMIVEAESLEEVKQLVETDIYYTANVWDKEKLVIAPFLSPKPF